MAEPTEQAVRESYELARHFLKGGAKASNKIYDGVDSQKAAESQLRIQGGYVLDGQDSALRFPAQTVGYGQVMRETGITYANCGQSTGLAASYAAERMSDVELAAVRTPTPWDHSFLVVGATPPDGMSLSNLAVTPEENRIFIIDVWAGICCHASKFPGRFAEKMRQWDHQDKRVIRTWRDENKVLRSEVLRATDWGAEVLGATLQTTNARSFGSPEQLQALRNHMARGRARDLQMLRQEELSIPQQRRATAESDDVEYKKLIIERRLKYVGLQTVRGEQAMAADREPAAFDIANDMQQPTTEKVLECYRLTRDFIKGGAKTSNKIYDPLTAPDKAGEAKRRKKAAAELLSGGEAREKFHTYTIGYGQVLRETGNTFGNCGEMTGLAASYVAQLMPKVEVTVAATDPCDHGFLVVGPKPAGEVTATGLGDVPKQQPTFVIDAWAGICCHASEFPTRLKEKMLQWEQQSKQVVNVWLDEQKVIQSETVPATKWGQAMLGSNVRWRDPHSFGTADELQMLRDHMQQARSKVIEKLRQRDESIREQRRSVSDTLKAIDNDRDAFVRHQKEQIAAALASPLSPLDRASLEDEQRTIHGNEQQYLDEIKQGRADLREQLDTRQARLDRKLQYLGMQEVRSEGPLAPIARQRTSRPVTTQPKTAAHPGEPLAPLPGGNSGRRSPGRK